MSRFFISAVMFAACTLPLELAHANDLEIYRCGFSSIDERQSVRHIEMSGNIIANDAEDGLTYLSLEFPEVSGRQISARIVLTVWDYHRVTLHPRGETASSIAHAEFVLGGTTVLTAEHDGESLHLECSPRG